MPRQISSHVQFDDLSGHDVRYDDITSAAFDRWSMMMTTLDLPARSRLRLLYLCEWVSIM